MYDISLINMLYYVFIYMIVKRMDRERGESCEELKKRKRKSEES